MTPDIGLILGSFIPLIIGSALTIMVLIITDNGAWGKLMSARTERRRGRLHLEYIRKGHSQKLVDRWNRTGMYHLSTWLVTHLGNVPRKQGVRYLNDIMTASALRLEKEGQKEPDLRTIVLGMNGAELQVIQHLLNWPRPGWGSGDGDSERNVTLSDAITLYLLGGWTREHPTVTEAREQGLRPIPKPNMMNEFI